MVRNGDIATFEKKRKMSLTEGENCDIIYKHSSRERRKRKPKIIDLKPFFELFECLGYHKFLKKIKKNF